VTDRQGCLSYATERMTTNKALEAAVREG